jgi:hypothetical protein
MEWNVQLHGELSHFIPPRTAMLVSLMHWEHIGDLSGDLRMSHAFHE